LKSSISQLPGKLLSCREHSRNGRTTHSSCQQKKKSFFFEESAMSLIKLAALWSCAGGSYGTVLKLKVAAAAKQQITHV
jgi:hypothetical protein